MKKIKYLGLIPARGGSKRVTRKNIRNVNGMPLLYWSIKYAKESKKIEKLIVSTEDREIKRMAESYNVEVLDRPKELSEDGSPDHGFLKHALENYESENVVLLRPTTPMRCGDIIDACITVFEEEAKPGNLINRLDINLSRGMIPHQLKAL